ncbi:MAG: RHS repeat-associated core domain-containing protein, partial [Steroidobacteraceae bacterium]
MGNLTYTYDGAGRQTSVGGSLAAVTLPAAVSGNSFNTDNALTGFNGQALSADANGNLSNDGTNAYAWDARNQLSQISGGTSASFSYDPFGRRVNKTIGGATTQFLYDGYNPVQELDAVSPPNVTANLLTGLNLDEYFSRTDSSGPMSFLSDLLGSTLGLTNSSGALATSYTYDPFGNVTACGTANANPYQFTGRENDGNGLYFYRARYYSPTFQRFVSQDPWDFVGGGPNLYEYTAGDPVDLRDPSGNEVVVAIVIARAAVGFLGASAAVGSYYLVGGCSWEGAALAGAVGGIFGAGATFVPGGAVAIGAGAGALGGALGPAAGEWGSGSSLNPWAIGGGLIGSAAAGGLGGLAAGALEADVAGAAASGLVKFPYASLGAPLGA